MLLGSCAEAPRSRPPLVRPVLVPEPARPPMPAGPARFVLEGTLTQGGLVTGTAPGGTTFLALDGAPVPVAQGGRFLIGLDATRGRPRGWSRRYRTGARSATS